MRSKNSVIKKNGNQFHFFLDWKYSYRFEFRTKTLGQFVGNSHLTGINVTIISYLIQVHKTKSPKSKTFHEMYSNWNSVFIVFTMSALVLMNQGYLREREKTIPRVQFINSKYVGN